MRVATLIFLIAVAFISACAGPAAEKRAPSSAKAAAQKSKSPAKPAVEETPLPVKAKPGHALIYVMRPSNDAALVRFNVFLDGKNADAEIGYTQAAQYIYFYVKPGEHRVLSEAENWADIAVSAKPGEVIFLRQNPEVGYVISRNSLSRVDQRQGLQDLKKTSPGTLFKAQQ